MAANLVSSWARTGTGPVSCVAIAIVIATAVARVRTWSILVLPLRPGRGPGGRSAPGTVCRASVVRAARIGKNGPRELSYAGRASGLHGCIGGRLWADAKVPAPSGAGTRDPDRGAQA
jgi:hypothetical protein